jgi:putative acyl-CoA dehydrogenase
MATDPLATHEVFNQPPPLSGYDAFGADTVLGEAVRREGADAGAVDGLHELGRIAGSAEAQLWGEQANANPPVLKSHDRYGHRADRVEYHPAYHELMRTAVAHGLHAAPWAATGDDQRGSHVARAAKLVVWSQVDAGHTCPISMTYSVLPALRHQPDVAAEWEPGILSNTYDPAFVPHGQKAGLTCGMGMTEKQGGSDVRANTTRAEPVGSGGEYALTGHKWFCSAPMSDAFLMLAYVGEGLSCFLVPRFTPDGAPNVFRIQRLKDKLGDRSNASSEVELAGTWARLVGEEGRGVRTIIEMVNHTRLDCTLGSTAIMRKGVAEAIHHASHRDAFGGRLVDKPLMANVLADLAVESEAATTSAIWLAGLFDAAGRPQPDERAVALRRIATPVLKYWTCKRAPVHAVEALECLGGAGFVEESGMPRLFRQSPLNGIWEGSGNVICLDVLRAMGRNPEGIEVLVDEITSTTGADRRLDEAVERLQKELTDLDDLEVRARHVVEQMALCLQGSLLVRHAPAAVADAFCATRLGADGGRAFGTLPRHADAASIVARHAPST